MKHEAHNLGSHANEHLHKFAANDGDELCVRAVRHWTCNQLIPCARRAIQQNSLPSGDPNPLERLRCSIRSSTTTLNGAIDSFSQPMSLTVTSSLSTWIVETFMSIVGGKGGLIENVDPSTPTHVHSSASSGSIF